MKRLLVTGTRYGWDQDDLVRALSWAYHELGSQTAVLVHGGASGVDYQASTLWAYWKLPTEAHPALWDELGTEAGPIRNSEMVALGADLCLAFPKIGSKGTYDTMRKAAYAGIRVVDWSEVGDLT
jgi:hypothetical protein